MSIPQYISLRATELALDEDVLVALDLGGGDNEN